MNQCWIYGLVDADAPEVIWYIGVTQNPSSRLGEHRKAISFRKPFSRWTQRDMDMKILEQCSLDEALEREAFWIARSTEQNPGLLNIHRRRKTPYWDRKKVVSSSNAAD